ncbi:hypothetical protein AB7C87_23220 [Natrarchaeobius sp. A-rgal3]|uniref:hypothetical protein n=1 Tax=Natrarchaeobius versutus TaxID=1679078 RepID=UPI003510B53F
MTSHPTNRRAFLSTASVALTTAVAGCLSDDDNGGERDDADEPIVDVAEATASEGVTDPEAWAGVEEIRLEGHVGGWVGASPDHVDRIENPTLVLVEGQEYAITWENRDGVKHNLALYDAEGEIVDEYATGVLEDVGATATLAFVARPEMTTYICEHQPVIQYGDIDVLED